MTENCEENADSTVAVTASAMALTSCCVSETVAAGVLRVATGVFDASSIVFIYCFMYLISIYYCYYK